jgi:hypothetical protein|tara:strand:+ start:3783 stop:4157 length:375 start_codon:yes stop_codon:yes gene_type:complete
MIKPTSFKKKESAMSSKPMSIKTSLVWSFVATFIWCLVSLGFISTDLDPLILQAPTLFIMMFLSMRLGAVISYLINKKWPQNAKEQQDDKEQPAETEIVSDSNRSEHARRRRESSRTKSKKRRH